MTGVDITPDGGHDYESLLGFSIREDAGAEAHVRIRDEDATGQIMFDIPFAADEGIHHVFPRSVTFPSHTIYVEEVTGSVTGVLLVDSSR